MNIENTELYRQHIVHYFDEQLGRDIVNLSVPDRNRLFEMLTNYADILRTLLHEGIPIIEHILGNPWNVDSGDLQHANEMIAQYEAWKNVR